jgi:ubiquinone/menaquinone biosynthesis C-methylase UbiE
MPQQKNILKNAELDEVHNFWNRESCGEVYAVGDDVIQRYEEQRRSRYLLEPYLLEFARFHEAKNRDVLEIGVGMGADHQSFAENSPRSLTGIDLTERAIQHVRNRFSAFNLKSDLRVANAECLPFENNSFDVVYSWGVIHHSPNTAIAATEILRVLKKGGSARVMIYHKYSLVGFMLWVRYALLKGQLNAGLDEIYSKYLESPGTKAFTVSDAKMLFKGAEHINARAILSFGDLLEGSVGQRHQSSLLAIAKVFWPRRIIRTLLKKKNFGLCLLIEITK